jgi:TonB family protein
MSTAANKRASALASLVACLAAGSAVAQVGPIQPVLVLDDGKAETAHKRPDLPESYSIPLDVFVGANGVVTNAVVTESSENLVADQLAAEVMRGKKFLPALDAQGQPVQGVTRVTVAMFKRGPRNVVKVVVKPPAAINAETDRVRKMMCADFLWEVERLKKQADVRDASYEVMPYTSARMYMQQKHVPEEIQAKFWDAWPKAMKTVVSACEKDELKFFYAEVLVPALDGVLPESQSMAASAEQ